MTVLGVAGFVTRGLVAAPASAPRAAEGEGEGGGGERRESGETGHARDDSDRANEDGSVDSGGAEESDGVK